MQNDHRLEAVITLKTQLTSTLPQKRASRNFFISLAVRFTTSEASRSAAKKQQLLKSAELTSDRQLKSSTEIKSTILTRPINPENLANLLVSISSQL